MKVQAISQQIIPHNLGLSPEQHKNNVSQQYKTVNEISYFPKSYIRFNPSFKSYYNYYNTYDTTSVAQQRALELEIRKQQDIKDALWAKSWDPVTAKKEAEQKAENDINYREAVCFAYVKRSTKERVRQEYNDEYQRKLALYNKVMAPENRDYYENLLKDSVLTRVRSASEIMHHTKGTMDSSLAGYGKLKNDMSYKFILPVTKELLEGGEEEVANGILLCGPTGCGKTLAAETIANETHCFVDKIETNSEANQFYKLLEDKVKKAEKRYKKKQTEITNFRNSVEFKYMTEAQRDERLKQIGSPRTVVIIDEFDRYFNPQVVSPEKRIDNINAVKLYFGNCAALPKKSESGNNIGGSAVTFICTTNYPKRIPINEDININKLTPYAVLPPEGKDMEDVIKFYINKANLLIDEHIKSGNSRLNKVNPDELYLGDFVKKYGPTKEDGAFSNDVIALLVTKAADAYIDNPAYDFNLYLLREFKYALRDIRPGKLQRYLEDLDKMGLMDNLHVRHITPENASEKESIEAKIALYTSVPEFCLTAEQLAELAALRSELETLQ